ncbi:MAG: outer membrane beta-barrel family protein [Chitinophagaceae bacterium]
MRINLILLIAVLILGSAVRAQDSSFTIKGVVMDVNSKTIDGATVYLTRAKDSGLAKTAITDSSGKYEFENLKEGMYMLSVSNIGFRPFKSQQITLGQQGQLVEVPTIQLITNEGNMLQEVSVVSKKPFIERKIDRTIINVDARISNAGANALEILEIAPGVRVGEDGTINLKGKSGVAIFIDDKPSYLSANDLVNYLRSLPAGTLDKIEIMTNPPARYDASGNGGVINIRLKKNTVRGFNGSVASSYGQGRYWRASQTLNFNWRRNKVNIFGNLGYADNTRLLTFDMVRQYQNPDESLNSEIRTFSDNKSRSKAATYRLGMDLYATKRTTWGVVLSGAVNPAPKKINGSNYIYSEGLTLDSAIITNNEFKDKWDNTGLNLNMRHQLDNAGENITLDVDYVRYNTSSDQVFVNDIHASDLTFKSRQKVLAYLPAKINIYSAKTDYTRPFKSGYEFEAGLKTSIVKTDNIAEYFTDENGVVAIDYNNTNRLIYDENINSAYANLRKGFKRVSFQAGLRFENTIAKGHQLGNAVKPDSSFKRNYSNLFPTFYVSYKLDSAGSKQLVLSYGKRIRRPYYKDLNPFLYFIDKFSYDGGNPFLKPTISHNTELNFNYKEWFSAGIMHSYRKDFITGGNERVGDVLIDRPTNAASFRSVGMNIELNLQPAKWWSTRFYGDVMNDKFKGQLYSAFIDTTATSFVLSLDNQFTFKKGWSGEITAFYRSRFVEVQNATDGFGHVNLGVRKSVLKNLGALRLSVRDIFQTIKYKTEINNIRLVKQTYQNTLDTRVITVSFSYRFGQAVKGQPRNRNSGGAEQEKNRVKTDD